MRDDLGLAEELAACLRHHAPECQGQFDAVAIFQAMHQFARRTVEAADGAGPREDRRVGDRGR